MLRYIGIDLGQKGSISIQKKPPFKKPTLELHWFWGRHGGTRLRTMGEDELADLLREVFDSPAETYLTIEAPVFMPLNGKKSIASMHWYYGFVVGMAKAFNIESIWCPTPNQWKKEASSPGKDKTKMVKLATRLFKHPLINVETADSVLISEACRLKFRNA
jgi:hypothetical protein